MSVSCGPSQIRLLRLLGLLARVLHTRASANGIKKRNEIKKSTHTLVYNTAAATKAGAAIPSKSSNLSFPKSFELLDGKVRCFLEATVPGFGRDRRTLPPCRSNWPRQRPAGLRGWPFFWFENEPFILFSKRSGGQVDILGSVGSSHVQRVPAGWGVRGGEANEIKNMGHARL